MAQKRSSRNYSEDPGLETFNAPSGDSSSASVKGSGLYKEMDKSTIILNLGDAGMAKVHIIVGEIHSGDVSISNELSGIYTLYFSQTLSSNFSKLESLQYRY